MKRVTMKWTRVLTIGVVLLLSGCAIDPTDLPLPGSSVSGPTYSITIEFSTVLNLPAKAKVYAGGVQVGLLDKVELRDSLAVATVTLKTEARLPKTTTAGLRQSTILGDIHIELNSPTGAGSPGFLRDGDTIPVGQTEPASNIEDMLRSLSNVVTGGQIQQLGDMINQFDSNFPTDPQEYQRIVRGGQDALRDLAANTDDLNRILESSAAISTTLAGQRAGVDEVLELGPARAEGLSEVFLGVVYLVLEVGPLGDLAAQYTTPYAPDARQILSAFTPALLAVAASDTSIPVNADKAAKLVRDKLIPFLSAPNVRIRGVDAGAASVAAGQQADQMIQVLRSIGMLR